MPKWWQELVNLLTGDYRGGPGEETGDPEGDTYQEGGTRNEHTRDPGNRRPRGSNRGTSPGEGRAGTAEESNPERMAEMCFAMGYQYHTRYERGGDPGDGERGEASYRAALEVYTREEYPADWARTQSNLGTLYDTRYERGGDPGDGERAEASYRAALEVWTREEYPADWARTQGNLGTLYNTRYQRGGDPGDGERAEAGYRAALEVWTREEYPAEWALTQSNLGNLYETRYQRGGDPGDGERAEASYRAALEVWTREEYPADWARTQHNLGTLYGARYRREGSEGLAHAAESAYRAALEVYTSGVYPVDAQRTATYLGQLLHNLGRYEEAVAAYQVAREAVRRLYAAVGSPQGRRQVMARAQEVFNGGALAWTWLGDLKEALAWADEGRARHINETAARARARRDGRPTREAPWLTRDRIGQRRVPEGTAVATVVTGFREAQALLWQGGDAITSISLPGLSEQALEALVRRVPEEAQDWIDAYNWILESLQATSETMQRDGGSGNERTGGEGEFLVTRQSIQAILEECQDPELKQRLAEDWEDLREEILEQGPQTELGWYHAYRFGYLAMYSEVGQEKELARAIFSPSLERTLVYLREHLWQPLAEALPPGVREVVLVPTGVLGMLPLGAAAPEGVAVTVSPSVQTWLNCREELAVREAGRQLLLARPLASPALPWTPLEKAWVEGRFREASGAPGPLAVEGRNATVEQVVRELSGCHYFHFGGHARYDWDLPEESGFQCTLGPLGERTLTVRRLEESGSDLGRLRLVTASCCEASLTDPSRGDAEFANLAGALLGLGTPAVVATLWSVDDAAAAFFMDEFYRLHLTGGLAVARAVKEAAQWLRKATVNDLAERLGVLVEDEAERREFLARYVASPRLGLAVAERRLEHLEEGDQEGSDRDGEHRPLRPPTTGRPLPPMALPSSKVSCLWGGPRDSLR